MLTVMEAASCLVVYCIEARIVDKAVVPLSDPSEPVELRVVEALFSDRSVLVANTVLSELLLTTGVVLDTTREMSEPEMRPRPDSI